MDNTSSEKGFRRRFVFLGKGGLMMALGFTQYPNLLQAICRRFQTTLRMS